MVKQLQLLNKSQLSLSSFQKSAQRRSFVIGKAILTLSIFCSRIIAEESWLLPSTKWKSIIKSRRNTQVFYLINCICFKNVKADSIWNSHCQLYRATGSTSTQLKSRKMIALKIYWKIRLSAWLQLSVQNLRNRSWKIILINWRLEVSLRQSFRLSRQLIFIVDSVHYMLKG